LITANGFRAVFLGLALFFGLHLFGTASAFAGSRGECPGPVSTTTDKCERAEGSSFKWDPDNPQTIDRDGSVGISVIGEVKPYTWSVSGTGFILSLNQTEEKTNSLYAGSNACGTAEITVKDGFGHIVKGYVRSDNGQWVLIGTTCKIPGPADTTSCHPYEATSCSRYEGKYAQTQKFWCCYNYPGGAGTSGCDCGSTYNIGDCPQSGVDVCVICDCETCRGAGWVTHTDGASKLCCRNETCSYMKCYCHWAGSLKLYEWKCP